MVWSLLGDSTIQVWDYSPSFKSCWQVLTMDVLGSSHFATSPDAPDPLYAMNV